jgi:Zn-dependent metalloprotease
MAQFQARKGVTTPYPKDKISQLAREVHSDGWVYFRESIKAKPEEIATKHKEAFGLGVSDVLQSTGTQIDELKTTRFRYQQLHAGIPVEGADFSIIRARRQGYSRGGQTCSHSEPIQHPWYFRGEGLGNCLSGRASQSVRVAG